MNEADFYSLSEAQFVEFVSGVLSAQGYSIVPSEPGGAEYGVDLLASRDGQMVGIQVKHVRKLSLATVRAAILAVQSAPIPAAEVWFVTSASLPVSADAFITQFARKPVKIIDGPALLKLASDNNATKATEKVKEVEKRVKRQWSLAFALIAAASVGLLRMWVSEHLESKAPLDQRIENVSSALTRLKDLEKQLTDIKADMAETQRARITLEQEYSKAKELEKLTAVQLAAVKAAVQTRTWREILIENSWAFVLGIGSSIFASAAWEKYLRWRSQRAQ